MTAVNLCIIDVNAERIEDLPNYINGTKVIKKYEAGRKRAEYLEKHRPVEKAGAKK